MSPFWTVVGNLIPSTWAIQGVYGISNMGATLSEQSTAYHSLWALAGIYFVIAYIVLRYIDGWRKR